MESILVVVHLLLAIGLVGLVLIQHGKGADMGAAFGSGASATVFGSAGAGNFLSRATAVLAALFFVTSLALAYFAMQTGEQESLIQVEGAAPAAVEEPIPGDVPAVPGIEFSPEDVASDVPVVPDLAIPDATENDVPAIPVQ